MIAPCGATSPGCRASWPTDLDRDFDEELDAHLAMLADGERAPRHDARGSAPRRRACALGGASSLRVQHRDARGLPALEDLLQDVRFAARLIARSAGSPPPRS